MCTMEYYSAMKDKTMIFKKMDDTEVYHVKENKPESEKKIHVSLICGILKQANKTAKTKMT